MNITGRNSITLSNVLIGELWECSGKSNMLMSVSTSKDAQKEIAEANYPNICLFTVSNVTAVQPEWDCRGIWTVCCPQTIPGFSAVGYFFGRELHKKLKVPIGLVNTSWGSTPTEAWTRMSVLESEPDYKPLLERWASIVQNYPSAKAKYDQDTIRGRQEAEKAKAEGKPELARIYPLQGRDSQHHPANLYNGMIAPLVPFGIAGAIWYQGESNAGRAHQYHRLFPAMIQSWLDAWGQGDFPFLFVQLANYMATKPQPCDSAWAELRETQTMTLSQPQTRMAVIIDIGEASDIHPRNKQDVGCRLALAPQKVAYGSKVVHSGPLFRSIKIEGYSVRFRFDCVGCGLVAKGGEPLKGVAIAGEDRMPASPLRTDDWMGVTVNNK